MASKSPIALILGAGTNIGQSVGQAFEKNGYKVAYVSRRQSDDTSHSNTQFVQSDFSDPNDIHKVFEKVKAHLGTPSVVVYNAYKTTATDEKDPLAISVKTFQTSLNVNTTSVFVALKETVAGWDSLPNMTASPTFIYTGNGLIYDPWPKALDLSIGKAATANLLQAAIKGYGHKGYRFYFADERKPGGGLCWDGTDGPAAAEYYITLAGGKEQRPWNQTFVKGQGYQKFEK